MDELKFDNVFITKGRWSHYSCIETVTVPNGGLKIGTLLKGSTDQTYTFESGATAVLAEDLENDTGADVTVKALLCKTGTVLDRGVTYAIGASYDSEKLTLETNHIDLVKEG